MNCQKCEKEFDVGYKLAAHSRWCGVPKITKPSSYEKICKCGTNFVAKDNSAKYCHACRHQLSVEAREKISVGRSKWLAANPDKHPWKSKKKSNSVPCEIFRKELTEAGLSFLPEFSPVPGRHFSLDVAFPTKRIGVEINGNQHYNSDKTLKKYYQDRHDLIVAEGWQVLELHYSIAFQKEKLAEAVQALKDCIDRVEFEYEFYLPEKKTKKTKLTKGEGRSPKANNLPLERLEFYRAKFLEADFSKKGFIQRAVVLTGVSDMQVRRIVKKYFPEYKNRFNTPFKFLPKEEQEKLQSTKGHRAIKTIKERIEEYKVKIAEIGLGAPNFRKRLAESLGVSTHQITKMAKKHFPELRTRSNK